MLWRDGRSRKGRDAVDAAAERKASVLFGRVTSEVSGDWKICQCCSSAATAPAAGEKKGFEAYAPRPPSLSLSRSCEAFNGAVSRRFPGFHLPFLPKQTSSEEGDMAGGRGGGGRVSATMISYSALRDNHLPRRSFGSLWVARRSHTEFRSGAAVCVPS